MEALDKPEVAYWSSFAGPGPRHEQKEQIRIHGVPADAMKKINESPTNVDLLAHYLFPWFDFWNSSTMFLSGSPVSYTLDQSAFFNPP